MNDIEKDTPAPKGINKLRAEWHELSPFERFEHIVMLAVSLVLVVVILTAFFRLVVNVYELLISQIEDGTEYKAFQATFGMLLTLLIAFEFRNSINAILEGKGLLIQVKIVILISLIAIARKFLVLDPKEYEAMAVAAYALVAFGLGATYWMLGRSEKDEDLLRR